MKEEKVKDGMILYNIPFFFFLLGQSQEYLVTKIILIISVTICLSDAQTGIQVINAEKVMQTHAQLKGIFFDSEILTLS